MEKVIRRTEKCEIILAPFSTVPKVELENVEVGTEMVLTVALRNPNREHVMVKVEVPKDFGERGFKISASELAVPSQSLSELLICFKPNAPLQCSDTIRIKTHIGHRFHLQLTSKAILPVKKRDGDIVGVFGALSNVANNNATRKRKMWNVQPTPVVVMFGGDDRPSRSDSTASVEKPLQNTTFSIAAYSEPVVKDETFTRPCEPEITEDSLEVNDHHLESEKENIVSELSNSIQAVVVERSIKEEIVIEEFHLHESKRGPFDLTFNEINFDNVTPQDKTKERRRCFRSLENISHTLMASPKVGSPHHRLTPTKANRNRSSHREVDDVKVKEEPITPQIQRLTTNQREPARQNVFSAFLDMKTENFTPIPNMYKTSNEKAGCSTPLPGYSSTSKELFKMPNAIKVESRASPSFRIETPTPKKLKRSWGSMGSLLDESDCSAYAKNEFLSFLNSSIAGSRNRKKPVTHKVKTLSPKSIPTFKRSQVRAHSSSCSRPSSRSSANSTEKATGNPFFPMPASYTMDSCGATTMTNPFAKTAIHPREFIDRQTTQFIKWINSVLTPDLEYELYQEGSVDIAGLWKKSVASSALQLAPSRETVCSQYHESMPHLQNLRKVASSIFQSQALVDTLYKIHAKIDIGYICVKDDVDLHCDQGLRYQLVELLMRYNPLWLRIGLETIYGRIIPLQKNNALLGLMNFIKTHFLSDQLIEKRNSYANVHHYKMPSFKKEMNDFIVYKFLSLIFFLDVAKSKRIIPYDPCLFNKNSPIKESEGMLNEFIKEFIKCVGQMKRTLKSLGFVLSHKQNAIDEYIFAVQTYHDLRDGACLTRLVEIILKKNNLIQKLRIPAISRLQKVHNVELSLAALRAEKMSIVDVTANDIVDGHREKIMSLLWQILHKFLKPRFEKASIVIQRWWRRKVVQITITRRIIIKRQKRLWGKVVKVQALWRGYWVRKNFSTIKEVLLKEKENRALALVARNNAAFKIQKWYRACVAARTQREHFITVITSVKTIQAWYRSMRQVKQERLAFQAKRQAAAKSNVGIELVLQQGHRENTSSL